METYVIGYPWCKHFRNVLASLQQKCNLHRVIVPEETPNRLFIKQKARQIIGTHKQIGTFQGTSPQIVVILQDNAVCIPGETELNRIACLEDYVHTAIDSAVATAHYSDE